MIKAQSIEQLRTVFGRLDENIKLVEDAFDVRIHWRDTQLRVSGEAQPVFLAGQAIEAILTLGDGAEPVTRDALLRTIDLIKQGAGDQLGSLLGDVICVTAKGRPVRPKTLGQQAYVLTMRENTVTLAIGPAGTGKTYLAVAMAVKAFRTHEVSRIILTRPAVEAGEKLGFLPGDLQNKVDPYLRPLYDALFELMGPESFQKNLERGSIEVAPLAYMRGRTLENAFVILDEGQNTTSEQMKMFLTRLGPDSRMVVTGDVTQIDLPGRQPSGLVEAAAILGGIEDIGIVRLGGRDVVRHRLIKEIIQAYEAHRRADNG